MPEVTCENCGAEFQSSDGFLSEEFEAHFFCSEDCEADYRERHRGSSSHRWMLDWNHRIEPVYLGGDIPHQYAIELEFFRPNSTFRESDFDFLRGRINKTLFLKHDGSAVVRRGVGGELNSVFMTLEQHRAFPWKDILSKMVGQGFRAWSTEGLISRDSQPLSIGMHVRFRIMTDNYASPRVSLSNPTSRTLFFFQKLAYDNPHMWTILGRRGGCRMAERYATLSRPEEGILVAAFNKYHANKYQTVRITPDSVEVRRFRGSLRYESVMAGIECVDAMLRFSEQLTPATSHLCTMPAFFGWAKERDYPMFKRVYLARLGEEK